MTSSPAPLGSTCPCSSGRERSACCGPFLDGDRPAPTAEALMRSRYGAHVEGRIDYLRETLHPNSREDFDAEATRKWAERSEWLGLDIRSTEGGGEGDESGKVEFVAHYREDGQRFQHHELSTFVHDDGRWYFLDGVPPKPKTVTREAPKTGRNDPCPCGSGKKAKKCCAA